MEALWSSELPALKDVTLSRRAIILDEYLTLKLHSFADASELAYGACVYLRATDANGIHFISLTH